MSAACWMQPHNDRLPPRSEAMQARSIGPAETAGDNKGRMAAAATASTMGFIRLCLIRREWPDSPLCHHRSFSVAQHAKSKRFFQAATVPCPPAADFRKGSRRAGPPSTTCSIAPGQVPDNLLDRIDSLDPAPRGKGPPSAAARLAKSVDPPGPGRKPLTAMAKQGTPQHDRLSHPGWCWPRPVKHRFPPLAASVICGA